MKPLSMQICQGVAMAGLILTVLAAAGCSTPHAKPVDCDGTLRPINTRPATLAPVAATPAENPEHGA